jgi:glycosyltransferase involved in cell wall biosynthesis
MASTSTVPLKNLCYIISGIDKALAFEWIAQHLDPNKYRVHFILFHHQKGGLETFLVENKIPFQSIFYKSKKDLPKSIFEAYKFLKNNKIDIVHAHLLDAGIMGMLAAWLAGIKQRIYTRHYSSFHHVYHPKGVWYDKIINKLSTQLIAVSQVAKTVMVDWEKVPEAKIKVIHHGFPMETLQTPSPQQTDQIKIKYDLYAAQPIIGVVSRYVAWKGVQYAIPAFKKILSLYPNATLVLANAKGEFAPKIHRLLQELPKDSYREIVFEDNLAALFHNFDLFVHVPVNGHSEAFGQVYVEALATGKPSVFTKSGVANDIAIHKDNCLVVDYENSDEIYESLLLLLKDETLRKKLSANAQTSVNAPFALHKMIQALEEVYG